MIAKQLEEHFTGMNLEEGILTGYRNEDGSLTMQYLSDITNINAQRARDFEIALNAFCYNFPLTGKYKASWNIEKIQD